MLVLLCIIGVVTAGNFATADNLRTILRQRVVIGVVTVGMTFVIIGGGIDLSVGAMVALASVWATTVATQSYGPLGDGVLRAAGRRRRAGWSTGC